MYLSVCLSVCAIVKHPLPAVLDTSGQRMYCLIGLKSHNLCCFRTLEDVKQVLLSGDLEEGFVWGAVGRRGDKLRGNEERK